MMLKAGFIGVGNMGGAIAERLVRQGVELHVHDRDPAAMARLEAIGATAHASSRSVADGCEIVLGCLPSVAAAHAAVFATDGVAEGKGVRYYLEMSTVGPKVAADNAARLALHDIQFIDAAVSGGAKPALAGTLAIMLAAPSLSVDAVRAVLQRITDRLFFIGDQPGHAQAMKLVNNIMVAANMATSSEALAIGAKIGLDPEMMFDVISASSGNSAVISPWRREAVLSGRFATGPKIGVMLKDIDLMLAELDASAISLDALPALGGAMLLWDRARERGMADDDMTMIIRVAEVDVGAEVRAKRSG